MNEARTSQPFDTASAWADPPGLGKALMVGVAIGVAISFIGVGGAFLAGGQGWGASIGMGAFVAFWGGLGFGGMIGGVVWATKVEEAANHDRLEGRIATPGDVETTSHASNTVSTIRGAIGVRDADADGVPAPAAIKVAS